MKPSTLDTHPDRSGVIGWFARNKVAANLLMALLLVGGVLAMGDIRREVFPDIDTRMITVRVDYPAASPEEVEADVCLRIEEAIGGIDGIDRIRSLAVEHRGTIIAELSDAASLRVVLNDIDSAVAAVDTLPAETEPPVVSELTDQVRVIGVVLHGDVPERTLRDLAERVRDDLIALDRISKVELGGVRPYEMALEISEEALRRHGLSLETVADRVRRYSLDLPAGTIRGAEGELRLQGRGKRETAEAFAGVPLVTRDDGTVLRVGDLGSVDDGFEEWDLAQYFDREPAVMLRVYRSDDGDAVDVARLVKGYIEQEQPHLPAGVSMTAWFDRADYLIDRIEMLVTNALWGLLLVWLCLSLLLTPRLAFWIATGIATAFLGAFWMLPYMGVSIHMMSLFAFIVVLGLVVDDAIVVGESIHARRRAGDGPLEAAIRGTREVSVPVTLTIMTTVIAFAPLLFTAGEAGRVIRDVPIVVAVVLGISLLEVMLILPAHLATRRLLRDRSPLRRVRRRIQTGIERVIAGPYRRLATLAVECRYATLGISAGLVLIAGGLLISERVDFVYMEPIEADAVAAHVRMPHGTPAEQTRAVAHRLEQAVERVRARLDADADGSERSVIRYINTTIGEQPYREMMGVPGIGVEVAGAAGSGAAHLGEVVIELLPGDERSVSATEVARLWRAEVGDLPGVEALAFESTLFSAGRGVHVELAHRDFDQARQAAEQLKQKLATFDGVHEIEDSHTLGSPELQLSLRESALSLGVTQEDLSRQVRAAFYGVEAQRLQRGRNEVKVMVRYPRAHRSSAADLENLYIRLPGNPGNIEVPLGEVASIEQTRTPARIDRADGRRIVSVTAEVDAAVLTPQRVNRDLANRILPELQQQWPGLTYAFAGEQAEQAASMRSLLTNFVIALLVIYLLLGALFRSYMQPLIVLAAMPLGFIGAIVGHLVMGLTLSFLSIFGLVALTGVIVNDALLLIDYINRHRGARPLADIAVEAGQRRFRPITLTTLTTFLGLTPMLLETSLQGQFLVPMAASLAFGIIFASLAILLFVPAFYVVLEDLAVVSKRPAAHPARAAQPELA